MTTIIEAEGARVGLITCMWCGAALLYDHRNPLDVATLHDRWHETGQTMSDTVRPDTTTP